MNGSRLPPGPWYPAPVQGIAWWTRPLPALERWRARYGKRFTVRLPGSPPYVMLSDPADVRAVFTAPPDALHPGEGARVLEPVIGRNSLMLLDEGPHMEHRRLLLPAFHGERMARLAGLMSEVAEREVARWPRGERMATHPHLQSLTLEIILRAVFGLEPGPRLDALRERLRAMQEFGDSAGSLVPPRAGSVPDRILRRVGPYAKFARMQEAADRMIFELVEERRRTGAGGDDVLAMLLDARHEDGSPMSREELRDELITMLVAGHETTASSLAWAFAQLPRHPAALRRLTEEIDRDEYLTATIQEVLRHRPVLPHVVPRLVVRPVEVGGWSYPSGVCLVPAAYLLHHDPEIYPDPYAFRPERFLETPPGTYTWIPFGGGRRRCIGASFAMLEMKVVLRAVLGSRTLEAPGGGPERAARRNVTVRPARGAEAILA